MTLLPIMAAVVSSRLPSSIRAYLDEHTLRNFDVNALALRKSRAMHEGAACKACISIAQQFCDQRQTVDTLGDDLADHRQRNAQQQAPGTP